MPAPTKERPGFGRVSDLFPAATLDRALRGREADREAVAKMLAQEWVRAGLVVGEVGVGKTAFLQQSLIPHLREAGMIPVVCDDPASPTAAYAHAVQAAAGHAPRLDERPLDFLIRMVGSALSGRLVVFLLDDLDLLLAADATPGTEGRLGHELGDLVSRVCGRPGGKARFLFTAADTRMHLADSLERRTGSLFPITSRHTLARLTVAQATDALADLITTPVDPELARAVSEGLATTGGVLPVDLGFAARAIRELGIRSTGDLARRGGARELCGRWIEAAAAAAGDSTRTLRLLAELAACENPHAPQSAGVLAERAGVAPETAARALAALSERGLCRSAAGPSPEWPSYLLAHEALVPRVAALTAPVAEGHRRARAILSAAAQRGGRLSRRDRATVERERIPPSTPEEASVLARTRRFRRLVLGAIAAVPVAILIVGYAAQAGSWHAAEERGRLVVRAGDPSLSAFWWMPHSPGFGSTVADTGVTRAMVPPDQWDDLTALEGSGAGYVDAVVTKLHPRLSSLIRYAVAAEDDGALEELRKSALTADDWLRILPALEPIARGGAREAQILSQALADPSPAVQTAVLATAVRIETRKPGAHKSVLAEALGSGDATMRRQAYAAIRALPRERQSELYALALAAAKDTSARQQALAAVAAQPDIPAPAAAEAAAAILADPGASEALQETGWELLESAWTAEPATAARAAAALVADAKAPEAIRKTALRHLGERIPKEAHADVAPAIAAAATSADPKIRVAALPLHARLSPTPAVQLLTAASDGSAELRAAQAEGWGELAKEEPIAVAGALEKLLGDDSARVRAAAARAYGRLGRPAQDKLGKLIKEGGDVGEGAAWGLVASVEAGGSTGEAVGGLAKLWKEKGNKRRIAARAFARLARTKPAAVLGYLTAAAKDKDDPSLRPIGIDGLCAALGAGAEKAARELASIAESDLEDTHARVAACLASRPEAVDAIVKVAPLLAGRPDAATRAAAAKALASVAGKAPKGKPAKNVADALLKLVGDPDRSVRLAALAGLAGLGSGAAGKEAAQVVRAAFGKASGEEEKLSVLEAATAVEDETTVRRAATDPTASVRRRALGAAVALKADVMGMLQRGLADEDASVRREAVRLLGAPSTLVSEADALRLVDAALRDRDPQVAAEALALLPRLSEPDALAGRIRAALAAASEREREWGARAALGLAARDPKQAAEALAPALADGAHDVRVAAIPALAEAWAQSRSTDDLASTLRGAEGDAMIRLTAAHALYVQATSKERREAVEKALGPIAREGSGFVKLTAKLTLSLIRDQADGAGFLAVVCP